MEYVLAGVPEYVANLQLPDPDLRDFYHYEQERVFWLNDNVENCAEPLMRMIMHCNKEDKGKPIEDRVPIKIMIDSNGGDVVFMWSIINLIETSKTPVWTINYCTAFSAAAEILASGHKRYALKGSHVMIHNGSASYSGQADVLESQKKYFDALSKKTVDHLLSKTAINPRSFKKKAVVDWWMDENEALELAIVDHVLEDLDEIM